MEDKQESLILALPKGRVYEDVIPILKGSNFELTDDPKKTRKLVLDTKKSSLLYAWRRLRFNINCSFNI